MRMVDTHSHLFLKEFSEDLSQVIERARIAGVTHIFLPNIDSTTIAPLLSVCSSYKEYCYPMTGLHPTSVKDNYLRELLVVEQELINRTESYVAIGEIGIDLYWDKTYIKEQQYAFNKQLEWALEYNLPVVIHCREAFELIYELLLPYKNTSLRGVFHSFTGTVEEAERAMEFAGFLLGINGVVTFKKSNLPEILLDVPLNRVVLETDSPYLTPVPNRGKRNESAYVKDVLLKVAEVYEMPYEAVGEITSENALGLFGMLK